MNIAPVSLAALMEHPPVRTTTISLTDGVLCQIHELPISVIDKVRQISEKDDQTINMTDVAFVATYALTGRKPTDAELATVLDSFGTSSVMTIYTEALIFSQLSPDAIDQEKKH